MVTIGIDPHKASHTAVALDPNGEMLGELRVVADASMLRRLRKWASSWPQRVWAIEGCNGIGKHIAHRLVHDGETVVDVPPKLSAQVRVFATGNGRKTTALITEKMAAFAPMPSASERMATAANPGLRRSARSA